ncbi:MAG: hypothetical protein AABY00_02980 [Nanoarchaeota archaeon]
MEEDPDKARAGMNELELSCFSLGNANCGYIARGRNPEETAAKMLIHFKQAHSEKLVVLDAAGQEVLVARMRELVH